MSNKKGKDFGMENALDFLVSKDSKNKKKTTTEKKKETKKKYTTVTVRIQDELLTQVKAVAYWKRRKIQDVYNAALENYLKTTDPEILEKAISDYNEYKNAE